VVDFVLVNLVVLQFECLPLRSSVESPLRCLKTCNEEKAKNDTNEEEDQETQEDSQETTVGDSQQTVVEEENNDDGKSQTGGEERGQQHQPTNGLRLKNKRRRENAKKRKRGENASVEQRKEAENNGELEQQRREASRAKRPNFPLLKSRYIGGSTCEGEKRRLAPPPSADWRHGGSSLAPQGQLPLFTKTALRIELANRRPSGLSFRLMAHLPYV
jgi:hypothetical protein